MDDHTSPTPAEEHKPGLGPVEGTSESVIVSPTWQNRTFNMLTGSRVKWIVSFVLFLATGLIVSQEIKKTTTTTTQAATYTMRFALKPSTASLPPSQSVQVWATADGPVAFASFSLQFDPAKLQLSDEITTTSSPLTRIVKKTSRTDANTTGTIHLTLALDPANKQSPPTGTFELAGIPFSVKTTESNTSTLITFDQASTQVVSTDMSLFSVAFDNSTVALNAQPSATGTPSPTPALVVQDAISPVITISNPAQNSVVQKKGGIKISSVAQDSSGISKMEIYFDSKLIKSCSAVSTCQSTYSLSKAISGQHSIIVRATDNSSAKNTGSSSVTITVQ